MFLAHAVVYFSMAEVFGLRSLYWYAFLAMVFLGFWFGFDWAWFLIHRKYSRFGSDLYHVCALWLGLLHYFLWASVLFWVLEISSLSFNWGLDTRMLGQIFYGLALGISLYGLKKSKNIFSKHYQVSIKNLPGFWRGKKAVMLADVHLGNIHGLAYIQRLVELVNSHKPDIVLIPGDFYDGPPVDFASLARPLTNLRAPLGVYFCNGNHEEFGNSRPFTDALREAGVRVLNNAFAEVEGLQIVGVDYHSTRGNWNLKKVLQNLAYDRKKPSVLLKHVPSGLLAAQSEGFSLMLSGHTHKAQMWPLNFLTKLIFRGYDYGHKPYKDMQVITTSGAGTWGPPHRVGSQSEIVVIEFSA